MTLLFLHGPPAAGKFTVGGELVKLTGWTLYHNHVVVDEVLKRHAFGTPGFVKMRDLLWREYFTRLTQERPPGVIFTFSPENSVPQLFVDWLFHSLPNAGVRLFSVALTASETEIEARLAATQRQQFKKLTDVNFYRQLRTAGSFASPLVPRTDLTIDTGRHSPAESARLIARTLRPQ
ncbi:MAG: shikimate kinase [Opitutae bacterium]|nr:shikimate kinase [Opitutae bacterium]